MTHQHLQQGFDDAYHPQTLWRQDYRYTQDSELAVVEGHNARIYRYDTNGRLETAATPSTMEADRHAGMVEAFQYDPCGNRVIDEKTLQTEVVPPGRESYSAPVQGNRLLHYGNRRFEYDRFGNLIAERSGKLGALTTYEYDCRHRLIKHTSPTGAVTTYTYDPFNRRTSKSRNGELTEFIWQGNKLVAQTRNHRDWQTFVYEPGTHRPLALIGGHKRNNPHKASPKVYWYQLDHLGTPLGLTGIQGQMVYTCEYDAYGKLRDEWFLQNEGTSEPLLKLRNPLRFQGQYEDEESGLFYNLNRYYDPSLGRYLTQDPVKLGGELNSYSYVDGNPVGWVDPLGLFKQDATGFENASVNQDIVAFSQGGAFGGELYPSNKVRQLVSYLERRNVSVFGTEGNPTFIGRADGTGQMLLPPNPTILQVKHELSHYLDFRNLGFEEYKALGRTAREESVLLRLKHNRSWKEFNETEKKFSVDYVDRLKKNE